MEVFVFLRNVNKSLLYPDASLQMDLMSYINELGIIKFIEFFGPKYCAMLLYIIPSESTQFPLAETLLDINKQRYASKIFFEYRQFKNFIVNLEKRFMLMATYKHAYFQPFEVVQKNIGKLFMTKVNEERRYLLGDPSVLLNVYPGIVLPGSLIETITELRLDPSLHNLYVLEANDKKICLTNRKISLLARTLPGGSSVHRIKLFERLIANLIYLPKIRKMTMLHNHHQKPTQRNYHGIHQKVGPKNCALDQPTIEVYYRFNSSQQ